MHEQPGLLRGRRLRWAVRPGLQARGGAVPGAGPDVQHPDGSLRTPSKSASAPARSDAIAPARYPCAAVIDAELIQYFSVVLGAVFFVVDPVAAVPLYIAMTHGDSADKRRKMARRASITVAVVLLAVAFLGQYIFQNGGTRMKGQLTVYHLRDHVLGGGDHVGVRGAFSCGNRDHGLIMRPSWSCGK